LQLKATEFRLSSV